MEFVREDKDPKLYLIEKCFGLKKDASLYAILIASVLFGTVYVKTRNLWVPIILHFIVNVGTAIIFCFTPSNEYPMMALITCFVAYCGLGVYGISVLKRAN